MGTPVNTHTSYDEVINEDLHQVIFDISPTETPVCSMASEGTATNTLHEWLTDELAPASTDNAQVEGEDKDAEEAVAPERLRNYTQISDKVLSMSGTGRAVDNAGTDDEYNRQIAKKGRELKRDIEKIILNNQADTAGSGSVARKLRGLPAWYLEANSNRASDGTAGSQGVAAVDGTQRALKEAYLKDVLQKVWDQGGDPDYIVAGSKNKQRISGFSGNANRSIMADDKKIVAAVDVYVSDFGTLQIVPDRFCRSRDVHVLQSDMIGMDWLRRIEEQELAKTGDADKTMLIGEYTLVVNNPAAHGVIADLND